MVVQVLLTVTPDADYNDGGLVTASDGQASFRYITLEELLLMMLQ